MYSVINFNTTETQLWDPKKQEEISTLYSIWSTKTNLSDTSCVLKDTTFTTLEVPCASSRPMLLLTPGSAQPEGFGRRSTEKRQFS